MRFADGAAEAEARAWIEGLLDERLPEDTSLHECLKSGEVLCRAVNAIAPWDQSGFPENKKENRGSPALCVSGNFQGKQRVFGAPFWSTC